MGTTTSCLGSSAIFFRPCLVGAYSRYSHPGHRDTSGRGWGSILDSGMHWNGAAPESIRLVERVNAVSVRITWVGPLLA